MKLEALHKIICHDSQKSDPVLNLVAPEHKFRTLQLNYTCFVQAVEMTFV